MHATKLNENYKEVGELLHIIAVDYAAIIEIVTVVPEALNYGRKFNG